MRSTNDNEGGVVVTDTFASFFDELALVSPSYKLYRMDSRGGRYYYTLDQSLSAKFYPSITHILGKTLPPSDGLMRWKANMGIDEAEKYMEERAEYGTAFHVSAETLMRYRSIDFNSIQVRQEWEEDIRKDLLSLATFIRDHNVTPLAIEIMLKSENGFACTIDLVCKMDIGTGVNGNITKTDLKNGTIDRITAIIDFKSGRKGFYESHEIQLEACKIAWNESNLGIPVDRVFNWSPKDWQKEPTYTLKEQTGSRSAKKLPYLIHCFKADQPDRPSDIIEFNQVLEVENIGAAYNHVSVDDLITRRHEQ
jgi:hypothetical protein